jgi:hypothetical protein
MTSLRFWGSLLLLGAAIAGAPAHANAASSKLWGEFGEQWDPQGRLPDFSYAGYHRGETPLPDVPVATNVKDFGAAGDGVADDTAAINAAIAATRQGAVFLPAGRYKITDYLTIARPGIVLRGAGPDQTVLWFPRGLDEVHPRAGRTSTGTPASGYSFDGAFVRLHGDYRADPLAKITAVSPRGSDTVRVDRPDTLKIGDTVLVVLHETPDHRLKTYLYDDDPGDISRGKPLDTKMLLRIRAIEGSEVRFDRPLRFETRAAWQPEICRFAPTVTESGVEHLRLEFPATRYGGHFKETGQNAIELRHVHDCWVRDVVIHNGDLGINIVAAGNTVDGVVFTADPARGIRQAAVEASTGHHAIQCKAAEDNLVTHFSLQTSYVHDLSVEHASGNVFADGRGADLDFDHHKDTPYENLFTAIDCGAGTRVWRCGGGPGLGRQSGARETFWGIRAARPIAPPPDGWGADSMIFVGFFTETAEAGEHWWEPISPDELQPLNLYAAQRKKRLGSGR